MSKKISANITCPHCGKSFNMDLYRSIWGEDKKNQELILSDQINVAHCPFCHKNTKLEFSLLYTNSKKNIAIWWEPKFDQQVEEDEKKYKEFFPNSCLANAPRIRDWKNFKNKIIELENKSTNNSHTINYNNQNIKMDIKLTFLSIFFLILTLFDYTYCSRYSYFCFNFSGGFYTILKFVLCGYFLYNAFLIYKRNQMSISFIISCLLAIVYNPFVQVSFEKEEWYVIHIVTICVVLIIEKLELKNFYSNCKNKQGYKKLDEIEKFAVVLSQDMTLVAKLLKMKKKNPQYYNDFLYPMMAYHYRTLKGISPKKRPDFINDVFLSSKK